ncbi:hypothetical protein RCL1_004730 [Eukaryota sp. TZLM3-RCL]
MSYNFVARPKAVIEQTDKPYRDSSTNPPQNLMYDRRIVRGSTINTPLFRSQVQQHFTTQKSSSIKRRKSQGRDHSLSPIPVDIAPVDGRLHNEIQTEQYLEELNDHAEEVNVGLQTDPFLDRPPTPEFIPQKTGIDIDTQIEEGDLFDFDTEVVPILDILVSKVLEQGLAEVLEEEELEALKRRQDDFVQRRNAELSQTERLEAMERRKREEIERRRKQAQQKKQREDELARKLAITSFSRSLLQNLETNAIHSLSRLGFFSCRIAAEVEASVIPFITAEVVEKVRSREESRKVLNDVILSAIKKIPAFSSF